MDRTSWSLMRQRDFALLWWGGLITFLGNWILRVGLPITVLDLTGSTAALAATTAASFLPSLVLGPMVGVFVDRWDRKRVMVIANLAQAAVLSPMLLVDSADKVWILVAVAFASAGISPFTRTAENALLPRLVEQRHLAVANSLNALNNNLARFIGPLIGGTIAVVGGIVGVAAINAATYLISAGLVFLVRGRHRADRGETAESGPIRGMLRDLVEGFAVVRGSRLLWILFAMTVLIGLGEGVMATLFVVFVDRELSGGGEVFGWVVAAQAVGGVAGGLTAGWFAGRFPPRVVVGVSLVLFGLCDLITFNYPQWNPSPIPALVVMVLVGLPSVLYQATMLTLTQLATSDRLRGRVFALRHATLSGCMLAGTGIAAVTATRFDVVAILSTQALTPILAGVLGLVLLRRTVVPKQ
ncbi:putative MFS family arabinose efflux permease [Stackebrandtia endophytica]|uniref:Putative MFS family arabinose efflux permease n=1 Tax=Stackebrandtia endophytica TaxID=1496996 RepID=A0A543B1X9_9ACTN|nr:MFS transporter [Stackebrandtia endophytica]TQL78845.1 putative MFS family arabinose efflux permease [Stackebrandtia endophytica]